MFVLAIRNSSDAWYKAKTRTIHRGTADAPGVEILNDQEKKGKRNRQTEKTLRERKEEKKATKQRYDYEI